MIHLVAVDGTPNPTVPSSHAGLLDLDGGPLLRSPDGRALGRNDALRLYVSGHIAALVTPLAIEPEKADGRALCTPLASWQAAPVGVGVLARPECCYTVEWLARDEAHDRLVRYAQVKRELAGIAAVRGLVADAAVLAREGLKAAPREEPGLWANLYAVLYAVSSGSSVSARIDREMGAVLGEERDKAVSWGEILVKEMGR